MNTAKRLIKRLIPLLAFGLAACEVGDLGTASTADGDFTVTLQVDDRFVHPGDQVPLVLTLRRTDGSNLPPGGLGTVVVATTGHGAIDLDRVPVHIPDQTTAAFSQVLLFSADRPGAALVDASFRDAVARVELVISSVDIDG